jgi:purine-nucleoside phosphorylase
VLCGHWGGVSVIAIDGRPHGYEGHTFDEVGFPTRLMIELGIDVLLLSNASGAVNPDYRVGDVMLLVDHINLMWDNPLIGENHDEIGPRFPDMCAPYDLKLIELAAKLTKDASIGIHQGVYLAMAGPSYETRSEYRMARLLGADVVGMSTVPEVLVARHAGIRCAAFSVVSNVFNPTATSASSGEDIVDIVAKSEPIVRQMMQGIVENLETASTD